MRFFSDCKNVDEAKLIYHRLAKLFHPDHGGDNEMMSMLTAQYDEFRKHGVQAEPTRFRQPSSMFTMNRPRFEYAEENEKTKRILAQNAEITHLRECLRSLEGAVHCYETNEKRLRSQIQNYEKNILKLDKEINELRHEILEYPQTLWEFIKWKWGSE